MQCVEDSSVIGTEAVEVWAVLRMGLISACCNSRPGKDPKLMNLADLTLLFHPITALSSQYCK